MPDGVVQGGRHGVTAEQDGDLPRCQGMPAACPQQQLERLDWRGMPENTAQEPGLAG